MTTAGTMKINEGIEMNPEYGSTSDQREFAAALNDLVPLLKVKVENGGVAERPQILTEISNIEENQIGWFEWGYETREDKQASDIRKINGYFICSFDPRELKILPKVLYRYSKWGVQRIEELNYSEGSRVLMAINSETGKIEATLAMVGFDSAYDERPVEGIDTMIDNNRDRNLSPYELIYNTIHNQFDNTPTQLVNGNVIEFSRFAVDHDAGPGAMPRLLQAMEIEGMRLIDVENGKRIELNKERLQNDLEPLPLINTTMCRLQKDLYISLAQFVMFTLTEVKDAGTDKSNDAAVSLRTSYPLYHLDRNSLMKIMDNQVNNLLDPETTSKYVQTFKEQLESHIDSLLASKTITLTLEERKQVILEVSKMSWEKLIENIIIANGKGMEDPIIAAEHQLIKVFVSTLDKQDLEKIPSGSQSYAESTDSLKKNLGLDLSFNRHYDQNRSVIAQIIDFERKQRKRNRNVA